MRLDYLSDLIEIERCQSISGAAQNLYLGQTTLSTILKNVEAEVGFKIFERLIGGVAPTPDGEAVLSLAKEICAIYECIQQIGQADRQSERTVALLAAPSIICGLALPLNAVLQRDHPCITLNLKETTGEEVGIRIIQNAANIGITYYSRKALEEFKPIAKKYNVCIHILFQDKLCALLPLKHPLAARDCIMPQDFQKESLALLSHFLTDSDTTLLKNNRFIYLKYVDQVKQSVAQQNMVSILCRYPIFCDEDINNDRLTVVPISGFNDGNQIPLCVLHRERKNLCSAEQILLEHILTCFQSSPP